MKKALCLLILIFNLKGFVANGQENQLYEKIQLEKESDLDFINMSSIFKKVTEVHQALNPFLNNEEISFIHYEKVKFFELSKAIFLTIPFKNSQLEVELLEVPASFYNYEVVTNEGQRFPSNKQIKHYRGVVKNNPRSLVAISFLESEVIGLVATDEGNFNLVLDKTSGRHVFFNDKNRKNKMDFLCETHGHGITGYNPEILSQTSKSSISSEDLCIGLYFETENDIFQTRGSVTSVEIFVTAVYNQVAALYQNENIETFLSEIFVWTTADPYTLNDLEDLVEQFQTNRTSFNGDLGQLLTFRTGVGGGIAAGFEGICNSNISERLSVAMLNNDYDNVPTYSWTVHIVAHEFGHLFGSGHTHACVWNGTNTAIDSCWECMESTDPDEITCNNCAQPGIPF